MFSYYWIPKIPNYAGIVLTTLFLVVHLLLVWFLLIKMRTYHEKHRLCRGLGEDSLLNNYSAFLFIVNGLAVVCHLILSSLFYDGIQRIIPFWTVEGFGILSQLYLLISEISEKGLFFGYCKTLIPSDITAFVKDNGVSIYAFSSVLTFWFHPSENNVAYLTGMIGTCLMFSHLGLFYTPTTKRIIWRFILNTWFIIHVVTASAQRRNLWYGYFISLAMYLVVTPLFYFNLLRFKGKSSVIRFVPFTVLFSISIFVIFETRFYYGIGIYMPVLIIYTSVFINSFLVLCTVKLKEWVHSGWILERNEYWDKWSDLSFKFLFCVWLALILLISSMTHIADLGIVSQIAIAFLTNFLGGSIGMLFWSLFKRTEGIPDLNK